MNTTSPDYYHYSQFLSYCNTVLSNNEEASIDKTLTEIFNYDRLPTDNKLKVIAIYRDKILSQCSIFNYHNSGESSFRQIFKGEKSFEIGNFIKSEFNQVQSEHIKDHILLSQNNTDGCMDYKYSLLIDTGLPNKKSFDPDTKYCCTYELSDYKLFTFGIYFYYEEIDAKTYESLCNQITNLFNDLVVPKFNMNFYLKRFFDKYEEIDNKLKDFDLIQFKQFNIDIRTDKSSFTIFDEIDLLEILFFNILMREDNLNKKIFDFLINNIEHLKNNTANLLSSIINKHYTTNRQAEDLLSLILGNLMEAVTSNNYEKFEAGKSLFTEEHIGALPVLINNLINFNCEVLDFILINNLKELFVKKNENRFYIYGSRNNISKHFQIEEILNIFFKKKIDSIKIAIKDYLTSNQTEVTEQKFARNVHNYDRLSIDHPFKKELNEQKNNFIKANSFIFQLQNFFQGENRNIFRDKYYSGLFLYDLFIVLEKLLKLYLVSITNEILHENNEMEIEMGNAKFILTQNDFDKNLSHKKFTLGATIKIFIRFNINSKDRSFFRTEKMQTIDENDLNEIRNKIVHENMNLTEYEIDNIHQSLNNVIFELFNILIPSP